MVSSVKLFIRDKYFIKKNNVIGNDTIEDNNDIE